MESLEKRVIRAMKDVFGKDQKRIAHAQAVLGFAKTILASEPGDPDVVVAAAVLHDIGIHKAKKLHNSSAAKYQEQEGPSIARPILQELGFAQNDIDHICEIIANHHSAKGIDTPEFRILWDADWLVNIPDVFPDMDQKSLAKKIEKIFKTKTGFALSNELYLR
jgi:HD superfamily phosphodiesterase